MGSYLQSANLFIVVVLIVDESHADCLLPIWNLSRRFTCTELSHSVCQPPSQVEPNHWSCSRGQAGRRICKFIVCKKYNIIYKLFILEKNNFKRWSSSFIITVQGDQVVGWARPVHSRGNWAEMLTMIKSFIRLIFSCVSYLHCIQHNVLQ